MRKNILGILAFVMAFVMIGSVSAVVTFSNPTAGQAVSGNVNVEWTNTNPYPYIALQYKQGTDCDPTLDGWSIAIFNDVTGGATEFNWNTASRTDGSYCLRFQDSSTNLVTVGPFIIDNTKPTVSFTWTGNEVVYETISFDASASSDTGSGIASYVWDFDDGETETGSAPTTTHIYNEAGEYDVVLTVTDNAGNVKTATEEIVIEEITFESETYQYEAGILGIAPSLYGEIDTDLTGVSCTIVPGSDEIVNINIGEVATNCIVDETALIPYSERGVHNVIIRAEGSEGIKYYSVTITVYTWWISLTEGWNLISIPMMPENTGISSVLGGIKNNIASGSSGEYTIFQYNAEEKTWLKAKPSSTGFTGPTGKKVTDVTPGYGYFIKMENTDTLKGYGDITPSIGGSMISATVANGWNLIGHYGLSDLSIFQALSSLRLNIENRYYDAITTTDGLLHRYGGYWMTAKFLPEGITAYTPSQSAINSVLETPL